MWQFGHVPSGVRGVVVIADSQPDLVIYRASKMRPLGLKPVRDGYVTRR